MHYWLMKSEPTAFSIDDLKSSPHQTAPWDGVRNYQARNMLRNDMQVGDLAFFYHSSCEVPGIVGIMEIVKAGYPDFTAFDPKNHHYDPKSKPEKPLWYMVDVRFKQKFEDAIRLSDLRQNPRLSHMPLLQRGSRLSIMPVTPEEWQAVLRMTRPLYRTVQDA